MNKKLLLIPLVLAIASGCSTVKYDTGFEYKAPEFGGYAVGRAQPSIIQAFDSNMVTKTFTNSWNKI